MQSRPKRRVWLLDANLLIALTHAAHVHHRDAHAWFDALPQRRWATCAITQLAFVRLSSNSRVAGTDITPAQALQALAAMTALPAHEYWPESPPALQLATLNSPALVGHRQVTDAYLLGLAALRGHCLATLDRGLESFARSLGLASHIELVGAVLAVQEPRKRYANETAVRPPAKPRRR
jgi:toxin-antitoxin system PIN domain toxin